LIARKEPVPVSIRVDKREELIEEAKAKEVEIEEKAKEIPEKIIPEERIEEEIIPEEKIPERRISVERKEERIERMVEKKDEAVQTDDDIGESSSDSVYSYSVYIIFLHFALYFYYKRMDGKRV
jgi:hypothetical protein